MSSPARITDAERREYVELTEWVRQQDPDPLGVRLCCPRGHLIAHVGLFILGGPSGSTMMLQPGIVGGYGEPVRLEHKSGWQWDDMSPERFLKVRLICRQRNCTYKGTFLRDRLTLNVARHARQGHRELRLTD